MAEASIAILDFHVRVVGPAALLRQLPALFPPSAALTPVAPTGASTEIRVQRHAPRCGSHQIVRDGVPVWTTACPEDLLPALEWAVSTAAAAQLGRRYLLVHAGAVAAAGQGIILPAASGSGKTTLVAGLLAAGFQYFSDEVAVLLPSPWRLAPFARSLCIKRGASAVLARLYPQLAPPAGGDAQGSPVQYLRPPAQAWAGAPAPVRYVILPQYAAAAATTLEPVSRATALQRLLEQALNVPEQGAEGVRGLVEMLRQADCFALTIGELDAAVALVRRLASG